MKRYITAAGKRKREIPMTYFYLEDSGSSGRRAHINVGIGATYTTNFYRQKSETQSVSYLLTFRGDSLVNNEDSIDVTHMVNQIKEFISDSRDILPHSADLTVKGRPDRVLGILESSYYGFDIYLNDNADFEFVRNLLDEYGLVI